MASSSKTTVNVVFGAMTFGHEGILQSHLLEVEKTYVPFQAANSPEYTT